MLRLQRPPDADAFINDLALLGHVDAVVASRDFGAQVVVDLQGHTLGTRMELCMARVAPVQLAYLIYPGTSGASCLDCAVVDPIVVPPEAARVYTERLVYLPGTYQVNDYERHAAVATYAAAPDARAAPELSRASPVPRLPEQARRYASSLSVSSRWQHPRRCRRG